jgi:uncharacterized protein DUF4160
MAKVKCFSIDGMELVFLSDDHGPQHFHAIRKDQYDVRVNFLEFETEKMFKVRWLKRKEVPRKDTKLLEEMVAKYAFELLREWDEIHPQ